MSKLCLYKKTKTKNLIHSITYQQQQQQNTHKPVSNLLFYHHLYQLYNQLDFDALASELQLYILGYYIFDSIYKIKI